MSRNGAPSGRTRLVDVALAAGVSAMTVSRTLREPDRVRPETRRRVLAKVSELSYLPNESARSLASRRSRIVGVVVPTLAYSLYAGTLQGLSDGLRQAGFELMLGDSGYSARKERSLVTAFVARGVDALVLTGVEHLRTTRDLVTAHGLPVAEIWDLGQDPLGLTVGFSNHAAGRAVGTLLASLGRSNWAFVGSVPRREQRSRKRLEGFRQAARAAEVQSPTDIRVANPMLIEEGRQAASRLLRAAPDIDAVFCANDVLACGMLEVARQRGRRVPEDVAIVGFGDFDIASIVEPSLTTVRIPGYRMGLVAAESLLTQSSGQPCLVRTVDLGFEIVRRGTA